MTHLFDRMSFDEEEISALTSGKKLFLRTTSSGGGTTTSQEQETTNGTRARIWWSCTATTTTRIFSSWHHRRQYIPILILTFAYVLTLLASNGTIPKELVTPGLHKNTNIMSNEELSKLRVAFSKAKSKYQATLEEQYGSFTTAIFQRSALLEQITSTSQLSQERLQRKLKIKLIEAQLKEGEKTKFTFGIGGHSTASAHGNLFSQNYGAVLEKNIKPIFESLDIDFYAKNYAISAMYSAPEYALCLNAIFGNELDSLVWDFGLTDGRNTWYYELYAQRAGVHPGHPILFSFDPKHKALDASYLEEAGMGRFLTIPDTSSFPNSDELEGSEFVKLPDGVRYFRCGAESELCKENKWNTSIACPNEDYPGQVPWHSGFKTHMLQGHLLTVFFIETLLDVLDEFDQTMNTNDDNNADNDFVCLDYSKKFAVPFYNGKKMKCTDLVDCSIKKFTEKCPMKCNTCSVAEKIYKEKILASEDNRGNVDNGNDESPPPPPSFTIEYLEYLNSLEAKDRDAFQSSLPPNNFKQWKENLDEETYRHLHRSNALCHISNLPTQARFDGLITNSNIEVSYLFSGKTTYNDEGAYERDDAPGPSPDDNSTLPWLTYANNTRNRCEYAHIDSKDAFMIRNEDKWMSMIVPNNAENEMYSVGDDWKDRVGLIILCQQEFLDGRILPPANMVDLVDVMNATNTAGSIIVNDVHVVHGISIDDTQKRCYLLENEGGYYFPPSENLKGQYEIKIQVKGEGLRLFLSSAIVI